MTRGDETTIEILHETIAVEVKRTPHTRTHTKFRVWNECKRRRAFLMRPLGSRASLYNIVHDKYKIFKLYRRRSDA